MIKLKRFIFNKVTLSVLVTAAIVTGLIVSTSPVKALNVIVTNPASGNLGSNYTFTVEIDVANTDLLPIQSVNLQIFNVASPTTYAVSQNLPLPSGANTTANGTFTGTYGTLNVSGTSGANWGYGYASTYGYGYNSTSGYGTYSLGNGYGYGYNSGTGSTSVTYNITWVPPTSWPTGTYNIKVLSYGNNGTTLTNPNTISFSLGTAATTTTTTTTAVGGGATTTTATTTTATTTTATTITTTAGGGATTTTTPPVTQVTVTVTPTTTTTPTTTVTGVGSINVEGIISATGIFNTSATLTSSDGNATITIPAGTTALTSDGLPLSTVTETSQTSPPAPPAGSNIVGIAYDFGPSGATFSPPIPMTFTYNPANLPAGVPATSLVVAFYNTTTGQWVTLPGAVFDTVNNTITVSTSHFTTFALLASLNKTTTTPASVISVTPTNTTKTNTGEIFGFVVLVIIVVAGIGVIFWAAKRKH